MLYRRALQRHLTQKIVFRRGASPPRTPPPHQGFALDPQDLAGPRPIWAPPPSTLRSDSGPVLNTTSGIPAWHICFKYNFTAAGVVQCGGRKTSPRTSTIVQFIFYFGSSRSAIIFWEIRNKWLVQTRILGGFLFLWTPFWFISVFESTAYLKFAKLQYVSSGFRCRVITGSLMRLY